MSHFGNIKTVWGNVGASFRPCLNTIIADMASLSAISYFGNFIDARWAYDDRLVPDQGTLQDPSDGKKWMSLLQTYESDLFVPAHQLVGAYLSKRQIAWQSALSLLATPAAQISELDAQLADFGAAPLKCFNGNARDIRLFPLIRHPAVRPWRWLASRFARRSDSCEPDGNT
jgi:hypothetical protein